MKQILRIFFGRSESDFKYNFFGSFASPEIEFSQFILGQKKKVVMFPQIGRVENFLSLTRPQNQICIRTNIFNLKNKTKQTKKK